MLHYLITLSLFFHLCFSADCCQTCGFAIDFLLPWLHAAMLPYAADFRCHATISPLITPLPLRFRHTPLIFIFIFIDFAACFRA